MTRSQVSNCIKNGGLRKPVVTTRCASRKYDIASRNYDIVSRDFEIVKTYFVARTGFRRGIIKKNIKK